MERTAANRTTAETNNEIPVCGDLSFSVMGNATGRSEPPFAVQLVANNTREIVFDWSIGIGNLPPSAIFDDTGAGMKSPDNRLALEQVGHHSGAPLWFSAKRGHMVAVEKTSDLHLTDARCRHLENLFDEPSPFPVDDKIFCVAPSDEG